MPIIQTPGFFDLQVNGFAGVDFNDPRTAPEQIAVALDAMRATGVTRCLPTIITGAFDTFARCARAIDACGSPAVAGIHMEGPYISPLDGFRGAHPLAHVAPATVDDFERRQEAANGRIVLVTLAPEVPGAIALVEHLAGAGVRVAIGHTAASTAAIADAVSAGARLATHLGNGCARCCRAIPIPSGTSSPTIG
jgi:N-acetylglucosamine-6-phosphate deacetylase